MMTLNTGFNCPPTFYFKFITKCAGLILQSATAFLLQSATSVITKCDKCYYKVQQILQSVTILLQSAAGITDKVQRLLQGATVHM